ncbi:DUF1906 domain-containing protein [Desulfitobacterium sp. Sab5]|uniref:DUF1906 domain-containing protein n=1 Tax=Desulfitobacterium nosdiversum TaxID=3375356 RepID=UPI003CF8BE24
MNGIDCATKLNFTTASNLKSAGIDAVGRYLGNSWKGLTTDEVKVIHEAKLGLFLIYETNPTYAGYFSYDKGISDVQSAIAKAEALDAPNGICIYFTVDYDAQPGDMGAIQEYFRGVRDGLSGKYLVGAYGSYQVMEALSGSPYPPDKYFQTYAWSRGQEFSAHIYQWSNDITIRGVVVDQDAITGDAGLWEVKKMFENLVVYGDNDDGAAKLLAWKLGALLAHIDTVKPEHYDCAKNVYMVGGTTKPIERAILVSGGPGTGRIETMQAVLNL